METKFLSLLIVAATAFFGCETKPTSVSLVSYRTDESNAWCHVELKAEFPARENEAMRRIDDSLQSLFDENLSLFETKCDRTTVFQTMTKEAQSDSIGVPWEKNVELSLTKATDAFLTFTLKSYDYLGGAHGSYSCFNYTYSRNTGTRLEHIFTPEAEVQLQPILRKGLVRYFHECGEREVTEENLETYLLVPERGQPIPLPVDLPIIDGDEITFTYQQYEIACYAAGMPSFRVPIRELLPHLTPEVKAGCK